MILQTTADYKRTRRLAKFRRVVSIVQATTDGMVIGLYISVVALILYTVYFQHTAVQLTIK